MRRCAMDEDRPAGLLVTGSLPRSPASGFRADTKITTRHRALKEFLLTRLATVNLVWGKTRFNGRCGSSLARVRT